MSFARQSLGSLLALVVGVVISIVITRLLGPEPRGEYALAVTIPGLILAVTQWGMPEALLQMWSDKAARGRLIASSLAAAAGGTAVVSLLVFLLSPLFAATLLKGVEPGLIAMACLGSTAVVIGLLGRRFIQLNGGVRLYNILDIGRNVLFFALSAPLALVLTNPAYGPIVGWLVAEVTLAVVALLLVRRVERDWSVKSEAMRSLLVAGAPVQVGILATFIGNEAGKYVMNASLQTEAVGIFAVALTVARFVLQISMALRTVLQSRIAAPGEEQSADLTSRVTRHGLLLMLILSLLLAAGSPLLAVVYGPQFASATPIMLALLPGIVAYGLSQLLAGHLLRVGRRGVLAVSSWTFAICSIAFQGIGIQVAGLIGAAIGQTLAYVVMAVVVLGAFARVTETSPLALIPRPSDLRFYVGLLRRQPA